MVQAIVLYGRPDDVTAFDKYYVETHLPIAGKIPSVRNATWGHLATLDDAPPPHYLSAILEFESIEELKAAFASPEGQAALGDTVNFATGGVCLVIQQDG